MRTVLRWWRCSDRLGRWLCCLQMSLAAANLAFVVLGPALTWHWWLSLAVAVLCAVVGVWHLWLGWRRRSLRWWAEFERRRRSYRWN